jgi:hypothetical protein
LYSTQLPRLKFTTVNRTLISFAMLVVFNAAVHADPQLSSWFTATSDQFARIYTTTAAETSQSSVTTWSRGTTTQSTPVYSGVHEVSYSNDWIYIKTSGLASHLMGPWYLDAAKTQLFPNLPTDTATTYRIPRTPVVATTKTNTPGGPIGYFVNGVALFDNRDTFSYSNANGRDADPMAGIGQGDGIWNREAYLNESVSFDAAFAHQAGNQYHYHAQAIALRYQLGDHVDYNAKTNRYSESSVTETQHSPILAWAADGYPVYGPYGYASAMDATSGVRRLVSGYVRRDGTNGTTNLNTAGRHTLPAWAATAQNRSATLSPSQYGPNVNATYPIGHYLEDYDYLGDLGKTQGVDFDLDRYNGRFCVTPDFPNGTYAYFETIAADGTPLFPFNLGRQFYGTPSGGVVTSISEPVTNYFTNNPGAAPTPPPHALQNSSTRVRVQTDDNVLIGGFIIRGGTKKVEVRAIGPSLTQSSVSGVVANPTLELYDSTNTLLASNDDWVNSAQRRQIADSRIPPLSSEEAAVIVNLPEGNYTGIVRGTNSTAGVGLVEIFDLDNAATIHLKNLSARGRVETSENVMIGGFILGGGVSTNVIVRGIGPSLSGLGVNGALPNPTLALYNSQGTAIDSNDDWGNSPNKAAITNSGLAPANDLESAVYDSLSPGSYTAIVGGVNSTTGVAVVEIYELD